MAPFANAGMKMQPPQHSGAMQEQLCAVTQREDDVAGSAIKPCFRSRGGGIGWDRDQPVSAR